MTTASYGVSSSLADSLFVSSSASNGQLESYAQNSLVKGLQLYSDKKYPEAIASFKRAVGYSPTSSTAINAYDYMAKSYSQLGDSHAAIETYKKSIATDSNQDVTHNSLANVYYSQGDYGAALKEYAVAAKLNPSAANLYSLGQGYLADGQYDNALKEFALVRRMAPKESYGDFGMGQAYAKQGQYADAIDAFQRAIKIDPKDWNAYAEMGYALADSGQMNKAREVVATLLNGDANRAAQLNTYLYGKTRPAMTATSYTALGTSFLTIRGPGTKLTALGNYNLASPDAQQTFSLTFQFSKPMAVESVQSVQNWTITRADSRTGLSGDYNFGMPVPATETLLPYHPSAVIYDQNAMTATVLFVVTQNSSADGTIDPSHIQFGFNGKDATGLTMDPKADQYTGFSGFA